MAAFNQSLYLISEKMDSRFTNGYVVPEDALANIEHGFSVSNTVLVTGVPGIGKTTLAKYYEVLNPQKLSEVHFFRGLHLDFDKSIFSTLRIASKSNQLLIIDGFDEIFKDETKETILKLAKEGKKYGIRLLITSRPNVVGAALLRNSFQVKLTTWNDQQVNEFLRLNQDPRFTREFISQLQKIDNDSPFLTPLMLNLITNLIKSHNIPPIELIRLLKEDIHYKQPQLEVPSDTLLILPETPQIITDVGLVNSSLIERVNKDPDFMYGMSTRQFEELVGELLEKEGYKVTITPATRDGGKDLLIVEQKRVGNFVIYVECKRNSIVNPVGVRLVRELYGTVMADRVNAGILVTSAYFSDPAIRFKEEVKSQLSLIDYYKLKKWIDEEANKPK